MFKNKWGDMNQEVGLRGYGRNHQALEIRKEKKDKFKKLT